MHRGKCTERTAVVYSATRGETFPLCAVRHVSCGFQVGPALFPPSFEMLQMRLAHQTADAHHVGGEFSVFFGMTYPQVVHKDHL